MPGSAREHLEIALHVTFCKSQDMPSMFYQSGEQELSEKDKQNFRRELEHIMMQHINSPR